MELYLVATKGKSWISKVIKWRQWGCPYTHIAYIGEHENIISLENPYAVEAWWNGVVMGRMADIHTEGTKYTLYSVDVSQRQKKKISAFIEKAVGLKYDWAGILGFLAFKDIQSEKRYFCSELVFRAFQVAGINLLKNTDACEVSPRMFIKSPYLEFEGDYVIKSLFTTVHCSDSDYKKYFSHCPTVKK